MAPSTKSIKAVGFAEQGWSGRRSISGFPEQFEPTAELRWPNSTVVYEQMRKQEGQLAAVTKAITLPLTAASFELSKDGVDPRVLKFVELQLGLMPRQNRKRRLGINWSEYAAEAFLAPFDGHRVFEQVYEVDAPPPDMEGRNLPPVMAHLRRLASRPPRTIQGWDINRFSQLEGIRQQVPDEKGYWREVKIDVDRLVVHVHDKEGSDWLGNSMLRSSYKHWLLKDMLLRISGIAAERNGVGIPVATMPEDGSGQAALEKLVREYRAGSTAGLVKPWGSSFELLGVTGGVTDLMEQLAYQDESMGRACLAMFLNLGHDNGARSLGDTMVAYFLRAQQALLNHFCTTTTEYVIRDLVELNFGPDEAYPELQTEVITSDASPTADALSSLITSGIVKADDALETYVRRVYSLPKADPTTVRETPQQQMAATAAVTAENQAKAAAAGPAKPPKAGKPAKAKPAARAALSADPAMVEQAQRTLEMALERIGTRVH